MADSATTPTPGPTPAQAATAPPPSALPAPPPAPSRRNQLFALLAVVLVVLGLVYLVYWVFVGRLHVFTDDAYVNADSAEITPQVAAQVIQVTVSDTQPVKKGQLLVQLDPTDAKVALDQA